MTRPIVRDPIYRRRRFDAEIIKLCVRWYITYRLSYRDLVAMMAMRFGRRPRRALVSRFGSYAATRICTHFGVRIALWLSTRLCVTA